MKLTRVIEIDNGFGYEWTFKNDKRFYTIEFDDSAYMDFYEDEASWLEALKNGCNTNGRIESMPNVFLNDEYEDTFYALCAVYSACGDIKQAFESLTEIFDIDDVGGLAHKSIEYLKAIQILL